MRTVKCQSCNNKLHLVGSGNTRSLIRAAKQAAWKANTKGFICGMCRAINETLHEILLKARIRDAES